MPFTVRWYNAEQQVLHILVEKPWSWDDYDAMIDEVSLLLERASDPIAVIMDNQNPVYFPGPGGIGHMRRATFMTGEAVSLIVNVGLTGLLKIVSELFVKVTGQEYKVKYMAHIEDALNLIAEQADIHTETNLQQGRGE